MGQGHEKDPFLTCPMEHPRLHRERGIDKGKGISE